MTSPENALVYEFQNQLQILLSGCEMLTADLPPGDASLSFRQQSEKLCKTVHEAARLARRLCGSVTAAHVVRKLAVANPCLESICALCSQIQTAGVIDPLAHAENCPWRLALEWMLLNPSI